MKFTKKFQKFWNKKKFILKDVLMLVKKLLLLILHLMLLKSKKLLMLFFSLESYVQFCISLLSCETNIENKKISSGSLDNQEATLASI